MKTALLATGALAMAVLFTALQAWEATGNTTGHGIRVSFAVAPVMPAPNDEAAPHRIVVQLTERKTGRHISEAEVDVIITSGDYSSGPLRMKRGSGAGRIYFETMVSHLPRAALYQVDFRLAGSPAVQSVHFDYRHGR